ncbi:aminotransferase V [Bacillaceae bacterium JMAK1]|nr:aminotransferase V [Bacillaceae bacterium JMAK1]
MTHYLSPKRTIMTPGPVEVDPVVLRAMSAPILGQFDPTFTNMMNDTMQMLRSLFQTKNRWAFPIDGTSRSGIESVLASVVSRGETVLIPVYGRFGYLLQEICERYGAHVVTIEQPQGTVFSQETIIDEIYRIRPDVVAIVHGETSTGCMQPIDQLGQACLNVDALFIVDAVATIGGTEVNVDEWQIDACIGGTQKCLSVPSGMAPITYNERIENVLQKRKKIERGIATDDDLQTHQQKNIIPSNYFDLSQLQEYWGPRRLNHHTEATSMLYALHAGLTMVLDEGLENRFERHRTHEAALIAGIRALGLTLFINEDYKLPVVTCVNVPEGIDADQVRAFMLEHFGVEIASSFGSLHGKIWRIGTMGASCRKENVLFVLAALEAALTYYGVNLSRGNSVQAALTYYVNQASNKERV